MDLLNIEGAKQAGREFLADARVSIHAILDRIDGTTLYGPNNVVMFRLELGKVKNSTVPAEQ